MGSTEEIEYTQQDVLRLQQALNEKLTEQCVRPGTNARGEITSRSSPRVGTVCDAWNSATPGLNGGRLCPTCNTEVKVAPGSGQPRDWDLSHNPSWTNRQFGDTLNRRDILNDLNTGTFLECRACNRSGGNRDGRFSQ